MKVNAADLTTVNLKFHYTLISGAGEVHFMGRLCLHNSGYIQCCLCSWPALTYLRQVQYKYLLKYRKLCAQCKIIYPREQLFTIFELETMGFVESEVSAHSLTLRHIAVWVIVTNLPHSTTSKSKRIQGLHAASLFTPRRSKGLSGRALRKLPFLAHALFVKVHVSFCIEDWWKRCGSKNTLCLPADNDSDPCTVPGGYETSCWYTKGRKSEPDQLCLNFLWCPKGWQMNVLQFRSYLFIMWETPDR